MGVLTFESFIDYVQSEAANVELPTGRAERRTGAAARGDDILRMVRRDMGGIGRLVASERFSPKAGGRRLAELALELASFLFAAGADHVVWRHWIGVSALGKALGQHSGEAGRYAALAGEWELLTALPHRRPRSKQMSERVLWSLLFGEPLPAPTDRAADEDDDEDVAWATLAVSVPGRQHAATEAALATLADYWMDELEDEWCLFHPRSYPDFEVPVCAVAAVARRGGFRPESLSDAQLAFLEPGLAEPEPPPIYPATFSLPAGAGTAMSKD